MARRVDANVCDHIFAGTVVETGAIRYSKSPNSRSKHTVGRIRSVMEVADGRQKLLDRNPRITANA